MEACIPGRHAVLHKAGCQYEHPGKCAYMTRCGTISSARLHRQLRAHLHEKLHGVFHAVALM